MANLVGKILANRYRIDESLGRGGMAEVYKAWDLERTTYLALKVLRQDLAQDTVFLRRFQREAQTLSKLQHPNIVRFYGIETDDLTVFMLMDYIEGTTLQAEIFRSRGIPLHRDFIYNTIKSVCSALHYAHKYGYVHCDIKPGNIMIDQHGEVLLTDFGIARMTDAATATMVGFGTPSYMAPELVQGQDPTPQSDIYSLGVVIYEMATGGERPFTGDRAQTTGAVSEKVRWEQVHLTPLSPKDYNPNIPPELESVILKCMRKNPENRFNNAMDLVNALEISLTGFDEGKVPIDSSTALLEKGEQSKQIGSLNNSRKSKAPQNPHNGFFSQIPSWLIWIGFSAFLLIILIVTITLLSGINKPTRSSSNIQPDLDDNNQEQYIRLTEIGRSLATATETITPTEPNPPTSTATETMVPSSTPTPTPVLSTGSSMTNPIDNAEMVYVPEGEFIMGSEDKDAWSNESPSHIVYLDAYWVYKTEVTNNQFRQCIQSGECSGSVLNYPEDNFPVVHVNWFQANEYCQWAGGSLPTEAEWEKAARGIDGRMYPWGDNEPSCDLANYSDCGTRAMPVGSHLAGASYYGALEMGGNVREWIFDWFDEAYYFSSPSNNPTGPTTGRIRGMRGGSWYQGSRYLRTTCRHGVEPEFTGNYNGFRCVQEP